MATTLTLPKEYGYVLVSAAGSMFLCMWHGMRIGPFRKAAKIPYPNALATPETIAAASSPEEKKAMYLFNCAQRAHYNYIENYIPVLPALLVAGVQYPLGASTTMAAWMVFRIMYATGYTRADKEMGKGRLIGSGFWFCNLGLFGMVAKMGWNMLTA